MQDNIEPMFADSRQTNNINLEKLISRLVNYWPSILISVLVALLFAFGYLRYVTPQYLIKARVLVKSEKTQAPNGALLEELGMAPAASNVENEVEIFKSRILMQRVVEDMDLHIQYFIPGAVKTTSLYNDIPFTIIPVLPDSSIKTYQQYTVNIVNNIFTIRYNDTSLKAVSGDTVVLPQGRFVLKGNLTDGTYNDVDEFLVTISPVEGIADSYLGSLVVELINRQINIINLSLRDVIANRGEDVLSKLIEVYQQANVDDKNEVANGTISFIEDRLNLVTGELGTVEKSIEHFKSTNKITDVEAQSKLLLDNTGNNLQELTQKEIQLRVLESLEKYIQDNNNIRRIMPATLIGEDVTLVGIVSDYNNLQLQRQKLMLTYTENSPYVKNVDIQLEDLRQGMKNYITSLRRGYQVTVNELRARAGIIENDIKQVPSI
jgi:tyrosine-protein kinase Etk/Wzc